MGTPQIEEMKEGTIMLPIDYSAARSTARLRQDMAKHTHQIAGVRGPRRRRLVRRSF